MRRTLRLVGLASFSIVLSGASAHGRPALPAGSLYDEQLHWVDDSARKVELSSFRGRPVVLTMFYSDCSSTYPVTLAKLREVEAALENRKIAAEFVLVSYESFFDTPHRLTLYREKNGLGSDHWHLLSGPAHSVRRFANRIGLGDFVDAGDHISHSFRILLLDENGVARSALDPLHARVASLFEDGRAAAEP